MQAVIFFLSLKYLTAKKQPNGKERNKGVTAEMPNNPNFLLMFTTKRLEKVNFFFTFSFGLKIPHLWSIFKSTSLKLTNTKEPIQPPSEVVVIDLSTENLQTNESGMPPIPILTELNKITESISRSSFKIFFYYLNNKLRSKFHYFFNNTNICKLI